MANLFPGAAQIGYNPANGPGYGQTPDQTSGLGLAKMAAMGQAPSAAEVQQRAGIDQAQRAAASTAASTRGAFGLAGAQRSAAGQQAGLAQQAVNSSAQLRAQEQATARGQYMDASAQARAQALQASGMSLEAANAQAQLEAQQQAANQQMTGKLIGGVASAAGALLSDERVKRVYSDFNLDPSAYSSDASTPNVASYEHPDGTWTAQRPTTDDEKPGLGALSSKVRAMAGPEGNTERGFDGWLRDQQRKQLAEAGVPHAQEIQPVGYVPTREQAMM